MISESLLKKANEALEQQKKENQEQNLGVPSKNSLSHSSRRSSVQGDEQESFSAPDNQDSQRKLSRWKKIKGVFDTVQQHCIDGEEINNDGELCFDSESDIILKTVPLPSSVQLKRSARNSFLLTVGSKGLPEKQEDQTQV